MNLLKVKWSLTVYLYAGTSATPFDESPGSESPPRLREKGSVNEFEEGPLEPDKLFGRSAAGAVRLQPPYPSSGRTDSRLSIVSTSRLVADWRRQHPKVKTPAHKSKKEAMIGESIE